MLSRGVRRVLDAFVVERFTTLHRGLRLPPDKDLIVGQDARIEGDLLGARTVALGKGCRIEGDVRSVSDVVVGAHVVIEGDVEARGNVLLQEGALVQGRVTAGGRARIIGARVLGGVKALGDVEVRGRSDLMKIEAGGRIRSLPAPASAATASETSHQND